jgi:transposase-like protein
VLRTLSTELSPECRPSQVEDIVDERGIDISHETVRFWVERFGLEFAGEIRRKRRGI